MIKLFIRNYILFAIVITVMVVALYLYLQFINYRGYTQSAEMLARVPLDFIAKKLENLPESKWQTKLNEIKTKGAIQKMLILDWNQLPLAIKENKKLLAGEVVATMPFSIFNISDDVYSAFWVYKRIKQSNKYLGFEAMPPSIYSIKRNTQWIKLTLTSLFNNADKSQWSDIIQKMERLFNAPITLQKISNLSPCDQERLKKYGLLSFSAGEQHISMAD